MTEKEVFGFLKKYKWYIILYATWVSFISFAAPEMYNWHRDEWWSLWGTWCILIPLIAYCVVSAIRYLIKR